MTLSDDDRAQIRARAEAATPGPWHICEEPDVLGAEPEDWPEAVVCDREHQPVCMSSADWYEKDPGEPTPQIDAAHIAGMDPATTLALLDERDNLAAALDAARSEVEGHLSGLAYDAMKRRAEAAEAKVAAVEALADSDSLDACECGHGLDEHNGLGCYARLSYNPMVTCLCNLTDDRLHGDLVRLNIRAVLRGEAR